MMSPYINTKALEYAVHKIQKDLNEQKTLHKYEPGMGNNNTTPLGSSY